MKALFTLTACVFFRVFIYAQLSGVIIEPNNTNAVPKFSKVELGIDLSTLPNQIYENRILDFLNSTYKPGTALYSSAYATRDILNPYDPDQINLIATFYAPSGKKVTRYGFFYRNFDRTGGTPATNWSVNGTDPNNIYTWRVRFAPDELGAWTGKVEVWVDGGMRPETFWCNFNVVSSNNPGYVSIDNTHPRYLMFSDNHTTYFPIGDNYAWTEEGYGCDGKFNCNYPNGYVGDHRIQPTINQEYSAYVNKLTAAGGNATRIIMAPWGLQIEREKLNNYDTRQVEMWELDQMFQQLEANGIYCILTLNLGAEWLWDDEDYDTDYNKYSEHWNYHPYAEPDNESPCVLDPLPADPDDFADWKGIQGVHCPNDFFTHPDAKSFFKKRLQYIVSRWGYSTSISMYELLSEIDQTGLSPGFFDPNDNSSAIAVSDWHDEMYDYMRNTLGDPHIRTGTFTGEFYRVLEKDANNQWTFNNSGSAFWLKPNIDMISGHHYLLREGALRMEHEETRQILQLHQYNTMPILNNENDLMQYWFAGRASDWGNHNKYWSSALSGTCGAGLAWDWARYYQWEFRTPPYPGVPWQYGTTPYVGEYEQNYRGLGNFISNIDFRNFNYSPDECHTTYNPQNWQNGYEGADSKFETFYLRRDDREKVYGWIHNRSFNAFTFGTFLNPVTEGSETYTTVQDVINSTNFQPLWCADGDPDTECGTASYWGFSSPQQGILDDDNYTNLFGTSYSTDPQQNGYFFIKDLIPNTNYQIDWYWTWGPNAGMPTGLSTSYTSNSVGVITVSNAPPTGNVNNVLYPGDWAFIVTKSIEHRMPAPQQQSILQLSALPNPSNGIFTLQTGLFDSPATIEVFTIDGRIVRSENSNFVNGYKLDLTKEAEGVYFVKVTRDGQSKTVRIVKTAE